MAIPCKHNWTFFVVEWFGQVLLYLFGLWKFPSQTICHHTHILQSETCTEVTFLNNLSLWTLLTCLQLHDSYYVSSVFVMILLAAYGNVRFQLYNCIAFDIQLYYLILPWFSETLFHILTWGEGDSFHSPQTLGPLCIPGLVWTL
jgi:hypothetical protein